MKDQYNNYIPDDLVLLNAVPIAEITTLEWKRLNDLDWYCFTGNKNRMIFVSYSKANQISSDVMSYLEDADYAKSFSPDFSISFIDSVLHRSNVFDGWYHS